MRAPTTIWRSPSHDGAHFARERVASPPRARCSASQRESGAAGDEDVLEAGPICLDVARYQVTAAGAEVQLTHKEFEMLRYLMENRGIVVSRDLLLDRVWGYSIAGETRTVDAMCKR